MCFPCVCFRPRVRFDQYVPASCTDAKRFSDELFQKPMVSVHLAVQPYRIFAPCPHSEELHGALYNEGFVYQYAARVRALLHMLVSMWLIPTVPWESKAAVTEVLTKAIAVCHK